MRFSDEHIKFMNIALEEAQTAFSRNEIPIGAVIVKNGNLISKGHNLIEQFKSPLKHAELIVIQEALESNLEKYLYEYTLYCTLEPCVMCCGAIINSRIGKLVYGAMDIKCGGAGSIYNILNDSKLNHSLEVISGVLEDKSKELLKEFFINKRNKK